jgi:EmrB/QacA subfamily drug resistance transporter
MSTQELDTQPVPAEPAHLDPRRWTALAGVALAQLMIGLDLTIMNIALPSAQRSLHLADADRSWVVTTFALAYGGLLLLGGRVGDLMGRRRALLVGLTGFALSSAFGGAAQDAGMLFAARAGQGVFGALMTPSVLATLAATFPVPAERAKAFGIYGTAMGSSSAIGVLLGGVLTEYLDWRWCMFVNLPIAAAGAAAVAYAVRPSPRGAGRRVDVAGAVLGTLGLMGLVFGFARADADGWGAGSTMAALAGGGVLLVLFTVRQARAAQPLLPLPVVLHRRRGPVYAGVLVLAIGMFAALFFLTFYLQTVRGYTPVRAGLAFLPLTAGLMAGVRAVSPLLTRPGAARLIPVGLLALAAGLLLLSSLHVHSSYWTHVLPVFLLLGLGTGWVLVTANSVATQDAGPDTAVAGAMVMTSQQVGASLGTALLSTIAASAAAGYATHGALAATVHGLDVAAAVAAVIALVAAGAVLAVLPGNGKIRRSHPVTSG